MPTSKPISPSTDVVLYDSTPPHVATRTQLEAATDRVYRSSLAVAKFENKHLSPTWKERVVTGVAAGVSYLYVKKALGERMASVVMQNLRSGKYEACRNRSTLHQAILEDLQFVCPDKHLSLHYSEQPAPGYSPFRSLRTIKEEDFTPEQKKYVDTTFRMAGPSKKIESKILADTQIGYFRIDEFLSPDFPETKAMIDESLQRVAGSKALIIDLRYNHGGAAKTVAMVASHLFDKETPLSRIYQPSTDETIVSNAVPESSGLFGGEKPIYILISNRTFSGGEALAYDLQSYKRAELVGQTTAGGAHPVRPFVIDDHTSVQIPFEEAINPNTGKNWERVGVEPDHPIEKDVDALAFACTLIEGKGS